MGGRGQGPPRERATEGAERSEGGDSGDSGDSGSSGDSGGTPALHIQASLTSDSA